MESLLSAMAGCVHSPGCSVAVYVNAHTLNLIHWNQSFFETMRRADILYADGASVLLAARFLGGRLPEKLTTTDVWPEFCKLAASEGYRFFLLGGEPGLAEKVRLAALADYPGLQIVGAHHGFFGAGEEKEVVAQINTAAPDVLWVGMGDPAQVFWADQARDRLSARLVVTCGGLFKFVSGTVRRAPGWFHKHGFEWVFRIVREPDVRRRYARDLPSLALRLVAHRFRLGRKGL
jgi:N-acetylglucosaminyldiphosphoundecaprenol N-acetyl-beta-D-mannosaminyltransferase